MGAECPLRGKAKGCARKKPQGRPRPKGGRPERVVLIGYRCSGKTSVGQVLATRLGWRFADTDAEVEREAGRTIADIVAAEGWISFRAREREAVRRLSGERRIVIAAGGGAVVDEANRAELKRGATVIYLVCDPATIAARMNADPHTASQRPALGDRDALEEIGRVLAEREPVYQAACDWRLETAGRGIGEIVAEIGRLLEED